MNTVQAPRPIEAPSFDGNTGENAQLRQLIMASDRTMLAVERTYAAWVRTGLAALASGVAARAFIRSAAPPGVADIMASLLILFSGFCFVAGVWRELCQGRPRMPAGLMRVPPALLIAANGLMVAISVLALIGIWTTES